MKAKRIISMILVLALCISPIVPGQTAFAEEPDEVELTGFEKEFMSPTDNDAKPYVRWWISPGRMEEEITRQEIQNFAAGGYGGVELVCLELATCEMNSYEWNETFYWIFDEAYRQGINVDVMLTEFWPLSTHRIAIDDRFNEEHSSETSQTMYVGNTTFTAESGSMTYTGTGWVYPSGNAFQRNQYWSLLAVTAAKQVSASGSNAVYDPATAQEITELVDPDTGAVSFEAPSEGTWGIFYSYQQATGQTLGYGVDTVTIDHLSEDGAKLLTDDFDEGIAAFDQAYDFPEDGLTLAELYSTVGGNFFADSLELTSRILWTSDLLDEFELRHGYDLTPYLPAIFASSTYNNADRTMPYEFDEIGLQVRLDYGQTVSELFAERHIKYIQDWARETFDMGLRYQVHSSSGSIYFDQTLGSIETDIPETESYALGNSLDQYRKMSGVTHMKNSLYTAEAAESNGSSWRETWTGTVQENGTTNTVDNGFLYYTNRLFAGGVNKIIFHGTSAKFTDYENQADLGPWIPAATPVWPGHSLMAGMNYGHEWDDKTPMWEHVNVMTDYLTRTQLTLQQGQGDIDLAYYKVYTTMSSSEAGPLAVNAAGYTFDYVSDAVLNMENAVVGTRDGQPVLAPDGPAYQALVIDQCRTSGSAKPYTMTLETAEKILDYARDGLPVVVIGDPPNRVGTYSGSQSAAELAAANAALQEMMTELLGLPGVISISDRADLVDKLAENGITPDANPDTASTNMFYHRTTEDAEFYFIANDSTTATAAQTVTFKGEGKPYLLDAWSGEITPITRYTAGDGTITLDIALAPIEQMLIGIAKDGTFSNSVTTHAVDTDADEVVFSTDNTLGVRTAAAGEYRVELSDGRTVTFEAQAADAQINLNDGSYEWTMVLSEWLPLTTATDTTDNNFLKTRKVDTEPFTLNSLEPWYAIDPSLRNSSGVATYTTSFTLEKGWDEGQGAILSFDEVSDAMRVFVNGNEVSPNQTAKTVDIGQYLIAGENALEVRVSSNLANYKSGTNTAGAGYNTIYQFGIIGDALVTPYMQTEIEIADKRELQALYDEYEDLTQGSYTEESWFVFAQALQAAGAVLADESATQAQVDGALENLRAAIDGLETVTPDPVSKEALQALYDLCDALDEADYTAESWNALETAMTAAAAVLADDDATQAAVNAALADLQVAYDGLVAVYTVTFVTNSDTVIPAQRVEAGGTVTRPDDPTREGYTFDGWYTDNTYATLWNFTTGTVTGDMTLYAGWSPIPVTPDTYTVTFNTGGGSPVASVTVEAGGKITEPAAPTRAGYVFDGWYTDNTYTTLWNFATDTVTGDMTLYAGWRQLPSGDTYTVTFDSRGGSPVASVTAEEGSTITEPTAPTRRGYTFTGWYKDAACTDEWNFATDTVAADTTLYAGWATEPGKTVTEETWEDGTVVTTVEDEETGDKTVYVDGPDGTEAVVDVPAEGEITAEIKLGEGVDKTVVVIPLDDVNGGTVAIIVHEDGTEEIIKWSIADDGKLYIPVDGDVTVKIVQNGKSFTDEDDAVWAKDAIAFVTARELFLGTSDTEFAPNLAMSRGMLATVLYRLEGEPEVGENPFEDVEAGEYYEDPITWAEANGVVKGTGGNFFSPKNDITREELSVMLHRYAGEPEAEADMSHFPDADKISDWAEDAMTWALAEGIITGKDGNMAEPGSNATRAEVATMLQRFILAG